MRHRAAAGLIAAALALLPAAAHAAPTLERVGSFTKPVHVAAPPDDHRRLFVVEQRGTIRLVRDGAVASGFFLDLRDRVQAVNERGLLSVAFPPDHATTRLLYVYYTDRQGDIRIEEYRTLASDRDRADPGRARTLVRISHRTFDNHNGGQLTFGPDGLLYAGTGDGGGGDDVLRNAQNPGSLLGKLLRIDPRAGGGPPQIIASGLRNPFRFSFDRRTGDLALADVGQDEVEEVDFLPRSRISPGVNFGWPQLEGNNYRGVFGPEPPGNVRPVLERLHSRDGVCSITGGFVVRDPSLPSLFGRYVYGDLCGPRLRSAVLRLPRATGDADLPISVPLVTSFGEDAAGCVYAAGYQGPVWRITETRNEVPCADRVRPALRVRATRSQRALRAVVVHARCDERCTVRATGFVRAGGRRFALRPARAVAPRARPAVRLRLALSAPVRRAVRATLRAGSPVRARVRVRARDGARNRSGLARRRVRVRR